MTAADVKRYLTDCMSQQDILALVEFIPSRHAVPFIKWLTYSEDTFDGKSRSKAYSLFESGLLASLEPGTVKCLQQIHVHLPWLAGAWTTGTAKKYFFRKKQPDLNGCQFQATMQNAPPRLDLGSRPTGGRMAGVDGRCFSPRNVIC